MKRMSSGDAIFVRSTLLSALLATTMFTGVSAAFGQDTNGVLETVVVTAEKRTENLQNVPMNVTAITSEKLEQLHLTDFTDFALYMPSVEYAVSGQGSNGGPGFSNVTMRGIASDQNGNHSGPLPPVGVYLDEQPITTINGTLDVPTYDLQRVEALSGPQGTLYGASSEAGTIRIITNKPDTSGFAASYSIDGNSVDHGGIGYTGDGMVNIPLSENAAIRIVAWDEHDAGYINNVYGTLTFPSSGITINNAATAKKDYNTVDKLGGRVALKIDLDDNWTITPVLMAQRENTNGFFGYNPSIGDLDVTHFMPEYVHDDWYSAALTVQGKIGNVDLLYSGGYMSRTIDSQADYADYSFWYDTLFAYGNYITNNSGALIDPQQYIDGKDHFTKQNHEFRIQTSKDSSLRLVAGAYYGDETHAILQDYKINGLRTSPLLVGGVPDYSYFFTVPGWANTLWLTDQFREDQDYAVFGELAYDILPNLTVTGGIRFFEDNNSLKGFFGLGRNALPVTSGGPGLCFSPTPIYNNGPCTDLDADVKDHGETHKINLTWHIDDDRLVYATYSTGFRPGGVNRVTGFPPYAPDTLTNYEVGWKTSWYDDRLRVNGAVYWENWNNFQFPFLGPNSVTVIVDGGQATVKGSEFDVSWLPIDSLTLTSSGAYNDAQLTQDYCGAVGVTSCPGAAEAPKGTQLPITPKWKINATARYDFTVLGIKAHVEGSAVHESGQWPDLRIAQRSILGESQPFSTFDFNTGIDEDSWAIELYIQNVTDERAQLGRFAECTPQTCGADTYILPSQPRTIGLRFSQKF
jgi:iron complex outermembrane recepter protein